MPFFVKKWFLRWNASTRSSASGITDTPFFLGVEGVAASSVDAPGNRLVIVRFGRTLEAVLSLRFLELDASEMKDDARWLELVDCPVRGLRVCDETLSLR